MSQSSNNTGELNRSSSALRNRGINPCVQAKLLAFQAKRQQMQQSKNNVNDNSNNNDDNNDNNNNNESNSKDSVPSLKTTKLPLDSDEEDLMNLSPLVSKLNNNNNNNNQSSNTNTNTNNKSPSTPLSVVSSTFSSPVVSPDDDKGGLSRRTSFRLSNTTSNEDDSIMRRTSFRINNSKVNNNNNNNTPDDIIDKHKIEIDTTTIDQSVSNTNKLNTPINTSAPLYPLNKSVSFLNRLQKNHSPSSNSSSDSLSSNPTLSNTSLPKLPKLPSLPSLPGLPKLPIGDDNVGNSDNNNNIYIKDSDDNQTSIESSPITPISAPPFLNNRLNSSTPTNNSPSTPKKKLSLSQRRGMKLNFNALDSSSSIDSSKQEIPTTTKPIINNNNNSTSSSSTLTNQMSRMSLNSNRSNMNKLRDNSSSLSARRNPMKMSLDSLSNRPQPIPNRNNDTNSSIQSIQSNASTQSNFSTNSFQSYAKYIDIKSGSLNFAGKASLHSKGIDFTNGSSFRISMDDLEILEELGHGNYGVVSKVLHKPTNIIMAMKEVRLELDDSKFRQILMELEVLHNCSSDCIVEFYGAFFVEGAVYMCMEFMKGGSLDKIYGNGINEIALAYITKRVVTGLRELKDNHNIIHRDVKPTNMLVNELGKVKLCDFGVSGNLVASLARTNIGCQSYMAPERIKHSNPDVSTYSVQSDIWSLGLSILEISKGCYPYPPETYNNVFSQLSAIVDGEPPELPKDKFSIDAQDFVKKCLNKNPMKRPTYNQLLLHPWLSLYNDYQGEEILSKIVKEQSENKDKKLENENTNKPPLHSGLQLQS
ncbi:mitogen-activated protein kinase kinase [Pichia kluyveri]|uniref:mitogen-activated protein kinase kinase n=1 Tax=Pichia kluyveri TaxID=36015 RepID=A0AAV5R0Y6_PICKL|nr:mitogen-activated protein kinase kinase [Pichia kluyveri]